MDDTKAKHALDRVRWWAYNQRDALRYKPEVTAHKVLTDLLDYLRVYRAKHLNEGDEPPAPPPVEPT